MNNSTPDREQLVADIQRIGSELEQANRDIALLTRLKDAEASAKRLSNELRKAQDRLAEANASEFEAQLDRRFSVFKDIIIGETPDQNSNGTVLGYSYPITVTRMTFDGRVSSPTPKTYQGFDALPSDVMEYLLARRADRIPARIMALAPNDPEAAIGEYLVSKRRGYVRTVTA